MLSFDVTFVFLAFGFGSVLCCDLCLSLCKAQQAVRYFCCGNISLWQSFFEHFVISVIPCACMLYRLSF